MDRICIFARVSTSIQEYDRQVNELTALAQRNSWSVEAIFCEKISGAKKNADRKELSRMVNYVQEQVRHQSLHSELRHRDSDREWRGQPYESVPHHHLGRSGKDGTQDHP